MKRIATLLLILGAAVTLSAQTPSDYLKHAQQDLANALALLNPPPPPPPTLATVPNVVGMSQSAATVNITAAGLGTSVTNQNSDTTAAGVVITQNPVAGSQMNPGSTVTLIVSLGPTTPPPPPPPPPSTSGKALLDDFTSLRSNHDSPAGPLWQPYTGASGYPGQTGKVEANPTPWPNATSVYHLYTPSRTYFQFLDSPYTSPWGFVKSYLKSGTWSAGFNRLTFWVKPPRSFGMRGGGAADAEFGTYTKSNDGQPSNQGDHYYHYLTTNWFGGRWMLVTLNRVVQHRVGTTGFSDPNPTFPENFSKTLTGVDYFDGMTRFYMCDEYGANSNWNGDWYFADFEFSTVAGEPDTLVSSVVAVYTGDHYELSWQGPRNVAQQYTVKYATASIKGGATAQTLGTTTSTGNTYTGVSIKGAAMIQPAGGMYFNICPTGSSTCTEIYLPVR